MMAPPEEVPPPPPFPCAAFPSPAAAGPDSFRGPLHRGVVPPSDGRRFPPELPTKAPNPRLVTVVPEEEGGSAEVEAIGGGGGGSAPAGEGLPVVALLLSASA